MPSEKKQKTLLKSKDYNIKGNLLRAFYDAQNKLVFVLDSTVDKIKPNVLLIMAARGNRKWDDVLVNDYNVDLETVRPKKDNKYQKLDIEYDGLVVYDNLIRAYDDGDNINRALRDLHDFREISAHRSATERLAVATSVADNARETIERTGDVIIELQAKIKAVRAKITKLRHGIGREPTKQSAAKILRAEAQLDALTGKLERAKKRLENANKRLLVAEDDIAAAQAVLDLLSNVDDKKFKTVESAVPVKKEKTEPTEEDLPKDIDDADVQVDDIADDLDDDFDDAIDDADADNGDVKPLFDKDPNIIDEKIAFKPISFDDMAVKVDNDAQQNLSVTYDDETDDGTEEKIGAVQKYEPVQDTFEKSNDNLPEKNTISLEPPKPVIDKVDMPTEVDNSGDDEAQLDEIFESLDEEDDNVDMERHDAAPLNVTPIPEQSNNEIVAAAPADQNVAPINVTPVVESSVDESTSIVAPVVKNGTENLVRPASPIVANAPVVNAPVVDEHKHKPSILYYVLLLVLIALSIFTLWLYQRSNVSADVMPTVTPDENIVTQADNNMADTDTDVPTTNVVETATVADDLQDDDENPFVASGEVIKPQETSRMEEIAENSLNKIAEAADIPVQNNQEDSVAMDDNQNVESATPTDVNKPEYKVTTDKVFTDAEPTVSGGSLCDGDVAPDTNGCCAGETYSVVNGQNVCCPDSGGDCFPPLF